MLRTRIIPALLLHEQSLVKTERFRRFRYIGDPANTVRIFNELEVDELAFLDITATRARRGPNFELLAEIASECFMPLSYGGGLCRLDDVKRVFDIGFEKVVINSYAYERPEFISEIARVYGTQAVVVSIDVKRNLLGRERVVSHGGRRVQAPNPESWAMEMERRGAGEILLTSVDREGTWQGFDLDLTKRVSANVDIPVIAQGGAGGVPDLVEAVREGGASSVAVGAMVVFQKKGFGVLVNFPEQSTLEQAFNLVRSRDEQI
ncbi:AglZ/HisF2 family acetamidino modification protein [Altererythrobacter sp. Root672]|uniref:AglZ/HisF2 family acetamidino modification protein n=1 Tax=Altererythrobacter sp. Root672 TaxID=1736584 RepID=UPI0006FD71B0|nr:AglZ/HisF2 family acetamidino modification protein [Altererythrobacter sp. Root672]KRA83195.1 glycosyl amidation-associated protein WbuZ [Altererythrobacter sp. Root672]